MRSPTQLFSFVVGLISFCSFGASAAAAESCTKDGDCVKGWSCQVTGGTSCASAPCADGQNCKPAPDCVPQEYTSCVPGPCTADTDCASGMVCYQHTETQCSAVPCAANGKCPPSSCVDTTTSTCLPRYLVPCTSAADCGGGFKCVLDEPSCACSGSVTSSGGSPSSDGGAAPPSTPPPAPEPAPPPDCTCEASTTSSCRVVPVTCSSDADCSGGWSCESTGPVANCASEPAPAPAADGGAPPPAASGCGPVVPAAKQCMPPYFSLVGDVNAVQGGGKDLSASSNEGTVGTPTAGTPTAGTPTAGSTGAAEPAAAPHDAVDPTSTAGCAVSFGSRTGAASSLFVLLGLAFAGRRRRVAARNATSNSDRGS